MPKEVWSTELNRNGSFCIFKSGVTIDQDCMGDSRISYTRQNVDIYTKRAHSPLEYRITLLTGCVWGPGTLTQLSNMTLKFVLK